LFFLRPPEAASKRTSYFTHVPKLYIYFQQIEHLQKCIFCGGGLFQKKTDAGTIQAFYQASYFKEKIERVFACQTQMANGCSINFRTKVQ